jgi:branched-chain amino acid transport system substrate-binding protein
VNKKGLLTLCWMSCLALVLLSLLFGGACAKPTTPDVIRIGYIGPLTGMPALFGVANSGAAETAVNEINDAGGVKIGGKYVKLEFYREDGKFTIEGETSAAERMVNVHKVNFITSDGNGGNFPITEAAGIVSFSMTSTIGRVGSANPSVFMHSPCRLQSAAMVIRYIAETYPDAKTQYILLDDSPDSHGMYDVLHKAGEKWGITDVGSDFLGPEVTDYYPYLTKAINLNVDVLVLASVPNWGLAAKQAYELGYRGLITMPWMGSRMWNEFAGAEAIDGRLIAYEYAKDSPLCPPLVKSFYEQYLAEEGPWTPYAVCHYNAVYLMKQVVEKAGTLDYDAIVKVLETQTFDTAVGKVHYIGKDWCGLNRIFLADLPISVANGTDWSLAKLYSADEQEAILYELYDKEFQEGQ